MSEPAAGEVQRLSTQASAIDPEAIEKQLAALWRQAGESRGGAAAVTRACLWNVIAYVPKRAGAEGAAGAADLSAAIKALPKHLASRTLLLETEHEVEGQPALDSWVSANCIIGAGGGKLVCSEEVTLLARGPGARHLPGLVRALLVPGVPTALVMAGVPDEADPVVKALVHICDRVVFDVDASTLLNPLAAASRVIAQCKMQGLDLGWLRRQTVREQVATLFDPPTTEADLNEVSRILVRAPASEAATARVLAAWLLHALKVQSITSAEALRWTAQRPGHALDLQIELQDAPTLEITFTGSAAPKSVRCGDRVTTTGCGAAPERSGPAPQLEALIARALATRSADAGFLHALEAANRL